MTEIIWQEHRWLNVPDGCVATWTFFLLVAPVHALFGLIHFCLLFSEFMPAVRKKGRKSTTPSCLTFRLPFFRLHQIETYPCWQIMLESRCFFSCLNFARVLFVLERVRYSAVLTRTCEWFRYCQRHQRDSNRCSFPRETKKTMSKALAGCFVRRKNSC